MPCRNIKEERFGLDFFRQFNLVIDALDNVSARKHVNRLCLAAEKPLIEAGMLVMAVLARGPPQLVKVAPNSLACRRGHVRGCLPSN